MLQNLENNITNNPGIVLLVLAVAAFAAFIIYVNFFAPRREIERMHKG